MPPKKSMRMEKTAAEIVAAAGKLFASQGYHGTSTREISQLSGFSENTIFRYFGCKEDLFWAAIRAHASALKSQGGFLDGIQAGDSPSVVLPRIFELLTEFVNDKHEALRLICIAFIELRGRSDSLCRELFSPLVSEVNHYLARSVEKGELMEEVDPSLATSSLVAMVLMHPHLSRMTSDNNQPPIDSQDAVIAYSRFWLNILRPRLQHRSTSMSPTIAQIQLD